jgi:hypothetical protein
MKKMFAVLIAATALAGCTNVDPGHVGVKVNRYGSSAGVENKALGVGRYFTLFGVDVYEYPIYTNSYVWANKPQAGRRHDHRFERGAAISGSQWAGGHR